MSYVCYEQHFHGGRILLQNYICFLAPSKWAARHTLTSAAARQKCLYEADVDDEKKYHDLHNNNKMTQKIMRNILIWHRTAQFKRETNKVIIISTECLWTPVWCDNWRRNIMPFVCIVFIAVAHRQTDAYRSHSTNFVTARWDVRVRWPTIGGDSNSKKKNCAYNVILTS